MITKLELIEYLKHTPENTNYNILYSSLYNGSNKEAIDEFIEVLSRGNLSLAALQPYLAKLYEDDKTISPEPLPPFSSGGGVQPDWNQNDATQPDYVKNRPFYTGNPVETVLVEESTIAFVGVTDDIYASQFISTFAPTLGETYTVYWDGTAYECICKESEDMLFLGNFSIASGGEGSDTGEPFTMIVYNEEEATELYTTDTSASHTISISGFVTEVVKIDKKYLPFLPKPNGESYLTFSSPNNFTLATGQNTKTWNGTLEYFTSDETWTIWDGMSALLAEPNGSEYVMYLRGTGNTVITGSKGSTWYLEGSDIACIGNIETLLDYATVKFGEHPIMTSSCYEEMFYGCANLTQAPDLPATTLANECYKRMFSDCTSLTQVPELPATTLAYNCYEEMFYGCTSLTQVPELPATTLANCCYYNMFYGCTSLKLSTTQTEEYTQEYRVPFSGYGTTATFSLSSMFDSTGGTFTGTPEINKIYYLSSDNMIAHGSDIANLNGYIKTMIDNSECIIPSSTPNSSKKFKITVDDSGAISATEVT